MILDVHQIEKLLPSVTFVAIGSEEFTSRLAICLIFAAFLLSYFSRIISSS